MNQQLKYNIGDAVRAYEPVSEPTYFVTGRVVSVETRPGGHIIYTILYYDKNQKLNIIESAPESITKLPKTLIPNKYAIYKSK